jgi:hypothetical protein
MSYPGSIGLEVPTLHMVLNRFSRVASRKLLCLFRKIEVQSNEVAAIVRQGPPVRHHPLRQHSRIRFVLPQISGAEVPAKHARADYEDGQQRQKKL